MNFTTHSNSSTNNDFSPLDLNKGDILDLEKEVPSLNHVIVAAGWDVNDAGKDNFDLDISAFLLNKDGRVTTPGKDVVYFKALNRQGIYLEGDNLTGAGDGDDERIHVNLDELDDYVDSIVFNVNIYECVQKKQTFGMVKNSYIRLLDADNDEKEICRFRLNDDASSATAVVFAKLFRTNSGWSFEALGESLVVADLNKLLMRYM